MSSSAVQLSFTLRTSPNVRTVHLLGSWDNYKNQLPLSALKDTDAKPGSWKGTFRFQGSHALKLGSRYWYYYIIDGYHVSHDPAKEFTTEKTTGRKLNILDVPSAGKSASSKPERPTINTNVSAKRNSRDIPQGRALSPQRIQCPKPQKPYASRGLREADYDRSPIEDLEDRFSATRLSDRSPRYASSPSDLSASSGSTGPVFSASPSSESDSESDEECRCNRYGVTRDGRRVKLDCGGRICGNDSSSESDSGSEVDRRRPAPKAAPKAAPRAATKTTSNRAIPTSSSRRVEVRRK